MSSHIGEVLAALGTCFDSLKILAGRPKDLDDAKGMLRARSEEIDLDHVRRMLQLLEEALSQSDLIPQLEQLIRREKRSAR